MTRKEKDKLHSTKSSIELDEFQSGQSLQTRYILSMSLTETEVRILRHVLNDAYNDEVATDVAAYLRNALERSGIKL